MKASNSKEEDYRERSNYVRRLVQRSRESDAVPSAYLARPPRRIVQFWHDPGRLPVYAREVGLPFYMDLVCWPWTIGRPASPSDETNLPGSAFTSGKHHWTPYRITGSGRETWLKMWRLYAERYREAGVSVLAVELMNEPAYVDFGEAHRS